MAFETFSDVVEIISKFIDGVYNTRRLHFFIGDIHPVRFEWQHVRQALNPTA
ncbi:hypothetical protein BH11PSE4_BH11PSE4_17820 [soil metagenome]